MDQRKKSRFDRVLDCLFGGIDHTSDCRYCEGYKGYILTAAVLISGLIGMMLDYYLGRD